MQLLFWLLLYLWLVQLYLKFNINGLAYKKVVTLEVQVKFAWVISVDPVKRLEVGWVNGFKVLRKKKSFFLVFIIYLFKF